MYKKTKILNKNNKIIDYEKWENFTDSEDSDEELQKNASPILPKNNP